MFSNAVSTVRELNLPNNIFFFGETLNQPRHNVLVYDRVPKGNIALFSALHVKEDVWLDYEDVLLWAEEFGIDAVPLLNQGNFSGDKVELMEQLLNTESFLGGQKIEGVVVKNLHEDNMIGDMYVPFLAGKYVSERFKEVHKRHLYGRQASKDGLSRICEKYRAETRWEKAIIHAAEDGRLANDLSDIGMLVREIQRDILDEESDNIKEDLFRIYSREILRSSTRGFPQFYKQRLMENDGEL